MLRKYTVHYFECTTCGFVQTEEPYWLAEAYGEAIVNTDIGPVFRNNLYSKITKAVILQFFDRTGPFVDFGGGYGLFVREMRDKGFDFWRHEKYCENLFAQGFDVAPETKQRFELLTAFEVFEHLPDPAAEIARMVQLSDNLLFTTELLPASRPRPSEWWYFSPHHGQHIAIYTMRALEQIAAKHALHLVSDGERLHLLSKRPVSKRWFDFLSRERVAAWIDFVRRPPSLLPVDFAAIRAKLQRDEEQDRVSAERSD